MKKYIKWDTIRKINLLLLCQHTYVHLLISTVLMPMTHTSYLLMNTSSVVNTMFVNI